MIDREEADLDHRARVGSLCPGADEDFQASYSSRLVAKRIYLIYTETSPKKKKAHNARLYEENREEATSCSYSDLKQQRCSKIGFELDLCVSVGSSRVPALRRSSILHFL